VCYSIFGRLLQDLYFRFIPPFSIENGNISVECFVPLILNTSRNFSLLFLSLNEYRVMIESTSNSSVDEVFFSIDGSFSYVSRTVLLHFLRSSDREIIASLFSVSFAKRDVNAVILSIPILAMFFVRTSVSISPPPSSSIVFTFSGVYSRKKNFFWFSYFSMSHPSLNMFA